MEQSKSNALAAFVTDGRSLLSATIASFVAGVGFLLFQVPTIGSLHDFSWFRSTCWLNPCSTRDRPGFPWERYGSTPLELDRRVALAAAGPDGTFLLLRNNEGEVDDLPAGDIRRLTAKGRWEISVHHHEHYSAASAIAIGSDGSYVIGAATPSEPHQGRLLRWEIDGSWTEIESPAFPYVEAMAVGGTGQLVVSGHESQEAESKIMRTLSSGNWEVLSVSDRIRVSSITMAPNGEAIVAGHADGRVLRRVPDGNWENLFLPEEISGVTALAYAGKRSTLLVGLKNGRIFYSDQPYHDWKNLRIPKAAQSTGTRVLSIGPSHTIVTSNETITVAWTPITPALCTWILFLFTAMGLSLFFRKLRRDDNTRTSFGSLTTTFIVTWIESALPILFCFSTILFYLISSHDVDIDVLLVLYSISFFLYAPYVLFRGKSVLHRWVHVALSMIALLCAALVLFLNAPFFIIASWMAASSLLAVSNLAAIFMYAIPALRRHTVTEADRDSSTTAEVHLRIDSIRELFVGFHRSVIEERDQLEDTLEKVAREIQLQSDALAGAQNELEETREKVKEYEAIAGLTKAQRDIFLTKIARTRRFEYVVGLLLGVIATLIGAMIVETEPVRSWLEGLSGRNQTE